MKMSNIPEGKPTRHCPRWAQIGQHWSSLKHIGESHGVFWPPVFAAGGCVAAENIIFILWPVHSWLLMVLSAPPPHMTDLDLPHFWQELLQFSDIHKGFLAHSPDRDHVAQFECLSKHSGSYNQIIIVKWFRCHCWCCSLECTVDRKPCTRHSCISGSSGILLLLPTDHNIRFHWNTKSARP